MPLQPAPKSHVGFLAKIIRSDFSWPRVIVISLACAVAWFGTRMLFDYLIVGFAPFVLVILAIVTSTMLAGPRAGLITLGLCQLATWYYVLPVRGSFLVSSSADTASFIVATVVELLLLWTVAEYRAAARHNIELEEDRSQLLTIALKELDHRTKNNFSMAAGLLDLQARRSTIPEVKRELAAAAQRLLSLEAAHNNLAILDHSLHELSLKGYISHLLNGIEKGAAHNGIVISSEVEDIAVPRDRAIALGLIVNELVTNALKHAFPDGKGRVDVRGKLHGSSIWLDITDDGVGFDAQSNSEESLGHQIIEILLRDQRASLERYGDKGSRFTLHMENCERNPPSLADVLA